MPSSLRNSICCNHSKHKYPPHTKPPLTWSYTRAAQKLPPIGTESQEFFPMIALIRLECLNLINGL